MPVGVREISVLGEFKPFGLVAEVFDGKPPDSIHDDYHYFLFDPVTAKQRSVDDNFKGLPCSSDRSDHELFIRGNRLIWSTGARVHKRFSLPSEVLKACWCRMGERSDALLCVLLTGSLIMFNTTGEVASVPLSHTVASIWPLPVGLLIQQESEGNSSSSASFGIRGKREFGQIPQSNYTPGHAFESTFRGDGVSISSHLILTDLLEEPQLTYIEERGKLNVLKEYEERTIWTSDCIPLIVSYNKGKMQHSVWFAEMINSNLEAVKFGVSDELPTGILTKHFLFRRIWHGKGSHTAASKVFLATDGDCVPIICFLLHEQKKMLALQLRSVEINGEITYDIKPDMSWSLPAIATEPVNITGSRVDRGIVLFRDILALTPENSLFLYSGKQCLCRFVLPPSLCKDKQWCDPKSSGTSSFHDLRVVGLADAVQGRINILVNSGHVYRCSLQCEPSSSLVNDCTRALAEGLSSDFHNQFLGMLWGDSCSEFLEKAGICVDLQWDHFCRSIMAMYRKPDDGVQDFPSSVSESSWQFLVNSRYHKHYDKNYSITRSTSLLPLEPQGALSVSYLGGRYKHEKSFPSEFLRETLDSLHAVYENLKLNVIRKRDLGLLVVLLCDIADFLSEESYLDHYVRDFPRLLTGYRVPQAPLQDKSPPSLFRWLETCLYCGFRSANVSDLPCLIYKDGTSAVSWSRKLVSFYGLLCGSELLAKKLSFGVSCTVADGSYSSPEELMVLAMVGERFGLQQLDMLPVGVSLPLRHALAKCRDSPPSDWPAAAYVLLGREDLAWSRPDHATSSMDYDPSADGYSVSLSTPYMSQLHPVAIPSLVTDANEQEITKLDDVDSNNGSVVDGMEHIFNSSTRLQYGRDLRMNETRRLLCSAKAVAIQTPVCPTASDQEFQQAQLWQLAQRTSSIPFGRGAFTLATSRTLLTEPLTVPKLVLAGRLPAQQNATVNLDPNVRNIQELKCWPEFHNAVAAGLKLAPLQGKISRTYITYNKPEEPNVVHAGLLLALGLHGHLRVLSITDIFKYFSQEHECTTVGLMLGLGASYRASMKPEISKCLYVHIPSRNQSSFAELELPTLVQSAALVSIGLLYEGSAHPQTMQTLLAEIGRRSGGDNVLEREGYAVSAGLSLGLVALGRGKDAVGFIETLVDRLFQYICAKETKTERSHLLASSVDEPQKSSLQATDGSLINVDVTAPGAIVALGLMFLKTESMSIFSRLSIPQTHFDMHYVRPDFIMLRVISRNLIMWSRIRPSEDWIQSQVPEVVQNCIACLGDEMNDIDEIDPEAFVQAYVNIVVGACISVGLKFAGTRDGNAQELLYKFAQYFLNEIKPVFVSNKHSLPKGLSKYVDRGTLETCLHLIILSLCVVMAGSGHLQTFRFLKFLRSRNFTDGLSNYGFQMAISLGIGFLFLGGGMRTFSTSDSSVAALLMTLYPRLPCGTNDNRCHLQAFRHLYVLATEARWIQTLDVDTGLPVYAPVEITIRETDQYAETSFFEVTPCVLPERAILKAVRVCGPRYWPHVIELIPEVKPWWNEGDKNDPFNSGILYIKRKVGACSYVDDPIGCQSLLSRAMHKVFGLTFSSANIQAESNGAVNVDQLVSTFSADPSLIAFAQLCCGAFWNSRADIDFQEFCLQVLLECVSKDRRALLQVYLWLYTTIGSMLEDITNDSCASGDTLDLSSLKLCLAYSEALLNGRFTSSLGIIQSTFLGSLRKRVEDMLNLSSSLKDDLHEYIRSGTWPSETSGRWKRCTILSWYLQWYNVPPRSAVLIAHNGFKHMDMSSSVPLLHLLFPRTHLTALDEIDKCFLIT